ncbi:Allantoate deiminase [Auxenochlorella protothecoides]|uniref:Allantoate deiminase n=2 Tax=Auxenochlorella protothecoides TaxID=3075 RepID=A0A087SIY1_AUXPR|nr:Allantoate deiminase [Auxenochlorella protothecoides]KFM25685.1 Allantoate deiminase [Auxenochlorella protothecoides]RMZ57350.1 hypothetical protein APUTEX25_004184 [Auxenochlorella protothecoides]|eukprot:RMZ57350.1 hypothetical protein APUTEX25_004184 [Auxenochlorella protothecoides]
MLQKLGAVSDDPAVLTRTYLSPAHRQAAQLLKAWMQAAGMDSWVDAIGNVHGRVEGSLPGPATFTGSHYDTVVDGGKYDGALGIIAGIAAVKALVLEAAVARGALTREEAARLPVDPALGTTALPTTLNASALLRRSLRVVGFADEEGVRFQSTYLGSRALAGSLAASGALDARDGAGVTLREALAAEGAGDEAALRALGVVPSAARAYVEVHMEQGPVLEAANSRLAAVSGIAGQARLAMRLAGSQGHAGTVPMALRRDPLPGAAEVVLALERLCAPGEDGAGTGLVCTVGTLALWPGASNVIPGRVLEGSVQLSMDIRSRSDSEREAKVRESVAALEGVCARRRLDCEWELRHQAPAVLADEGVTQALMAAVAASAGLTDAILAEGLAPNTPANADGEGADEEPSHGSPPAAHAPADGGGAAFAAAVAGPLVSGAGHDAAEMARLTRMGMLFVRCRAGVSHSPLEYVAPDDVAAATAALHAYLAGEEAA